VENVTVRSCCRITSTGFILISLCRHLSWRFIIRWGMWLGLILVYEYIFTVDADTVHFSALLIFILALLIVLLVSRLLLRILSIVWSPPVPMTQIIGMWAHGTKKVRAGPWFKSTNTTSLVIYPKPLRVFSDPSPVYLVVSLSTVFVPLIKEANHHLWSRQFDGS